MTPDEKEAAHVDALRSFHAAVASATCEIAEILADELSKMKTAIDAELSEDGLGQCTITMRDGVLYCSAPTHSLRYPVEVHHSKLPAAVRWALRREGVHELTIKGLT